MNEIKNLIKEYYHLSKKADKANNKIISKLEKAFKSELNDINSKLPEDYKYRGYQVRSDFMIQLLHNNSNKLLNDYADIDRKKFQRIMKNGGNRIKEKYGVKLLCEAIK